MRSVEASLERLGVDRIDILLVHDIDVFTHGSRAEVRPRASTSSWPRATTRCVALRDEGVIRAFGGGINEWQVCQTLAERGDFDLFLLAGRYTLLEQEALDELPAALRGARHRHRPRRPLQLRHPRHRRRCPAPSTTTSPRRRRSSTASRRIEAVCRAHGVPLIAAALQFPLRHPAVVSVIPGGQTPDEVRANLAVLDTPIPPALWTDLKAEGLLRSDAPTA